MLALKRSPLRSAFRSLASSTAKILRFPARQEAAQPNPARRRLMLAALPQRLSRRFLCLAEAGRVALPRTRS